MTYRILGAVALALGASIAAPAAGANQSITLDARLAQPVMKDGVAAKNYLRVALGGCRPQPAQNRTPVNVAIVIDRSGSMQGLRIAQAREAAIMAVYRLGPQDTASVVVFDQRVDVLVPAQQVADHGFFRNRIQQVGVGGSTAIYDGVLAGRDQVLRFRDSRRLNRVVLLSDGQANVGPSRPDDFARLGAALLAQGISVSTIGLGLGYNEDLMLQLARSSDGNHTFAAEPADLVNIFNREFNDVLASCAQTVSIDIELRPGVRALKALSRDGTIEGSKAQFRLNQVYAATEHYVLLEVEVDRNLAIAGASEQELGTVKVGFTQAQGGAQQTLTAAIRGRFSASEAEIRAGADTKVAEAVLEQVVAERNRQAVTLRDQGRYDEAQGLLKQNAAEIRAYTATAKSPSQHLFQLGDQYQALSGQPAPATAEERSYQRKTLRSMEYAPAGSATRR
jgi:Ca-activated chloride channel family protein